MGLRRRRRGFERAGRIGIDQLGLSRRRARELALQTAWLEVAGEALARRAKPIGIARGVLELAVEDERWIESLRGLIPRLAGRLAARHPELGVRRFRLRKGEVQSIEPSAAVPLEEQAGQTTDAGQRPPVDEATPLEQGSPTERLERVIARYLRRSSRR